MSADRIARLASQLLGDLAAVDEISDHRKAADQQRLQLILEAFERVGEVAIEQRTLGMVEAIKALGPVARQVPVGEFTEYVASSSSFNQPTDNGSPQKET
jgi:hypothetical protein